MLQLQCATFAINVGSTTDHATTAASASITAFLTSNDDILKKSTFVST